MIVELSLDDLNALVDGFRRERAPSPAELIFLDGLVRKVQAQLQQKEQEQNGSQGNE